MKYCSYVNKNGEKIVKNRKLNISKIQNSTFMRANEKKLQEKFEKKKIKSDLREE